MAIEERNDMRRIDKNEGMGVIEMADAGQVDERNANKEDNEVEIDTKINNDGTNITVGASSAETDAGYFGNLIINKIETCKVNSDERDDEGNENKEEDDGDNHDEQEDDEIDRDEEDNGIELKRT